MRVLLAQKFDLLSRGFSNLSCQRLLALNLLKVSRQVTDNRLRDLLTLLKLIEEMATLDGILLLLRDPLREVSIVDTSTLPHLRVLRSDPLTVFVIRDQFLEELQHWHCGGHVRLERGHQGVKERFLGTDGPVLRHLCEFGDAALKDFLAVVFRVADDAPEVDADLVGEFGGFAAAAEHGEDVELFNAQLSCLRLRDLLENVLHVHLLKIEVDLVQDLENFEFVVTFCQMPELGEQLLREQVSLEEAAHDVTRALDQLYVCLLRLPDDLEHTVGRDPVDDGGGRLRIVSDSSLSDNFVQLFDALDALFEELGLKASLDELELEDLHCLVSL